MHPPSKPTQFTERILHLRFYVKTETEDSGSNGVDSTEWNSPILPAEVAMPGRYILVREPSGDIKHDDSALTVDTAYFTEHYNYFYAHHMDLKIK